MRILKESYTREEIRQRVFDTQNIFDALIESFYILSSSLKDTDANTETNEKLARYANGYIREIEALISDFNDDFEDFIVDKVEEEDFEDDYEYEVDSDI